MTVAAIVCGGQTGVDQGAARGALDVGMKVEGFRPALTRKQSETGEIPDWLVRRLKPIEFGGYAERTIANVHLADALLVVVPNRQRVHASPGTSLTIKKARQAGLQIWVTSPTTRCVEEISAWLVQLACAYEKPMKLMVAGPRGSSWSDGFAATQGIVSRLFERQLSFPEV